MQKLRKRDDFILPHICLFLKHTKCIQGEEKEGGKSRQQQHRHRQAAVPYVKYARFT